MKYPCNGLVSHPGAGEGEGVVMPFSLYAVQSGLWYSFNNQHLNNVYSLMSKYPGDNMFMYRIAKALLQRNLN